MTSDEIKLFSNMMVLLPKIELKKTYIEEDYFRIFELSKGYKKLEQYFENSTIINGLLDKKIRDISLYDLLRIVRNGYSHIDKHNAINCFVVLQTEIKSEIIHKLINEIINGMDVIFNNYFRENPYSLIMNTKGVMTIFEFIKDVVNNTQSNDDFDEQTKKILKPIINEFKYDVSSIYDYYELLSKTIEAYKLPFIRDEIIHRYGESIYNDMIRMMSDENFTDEEADSLINKIKETISIKENN